MDPDRSKREVNVVSLGRTRYKSAWDLQRAIFDLRAAGKISDVVLLNEHEHVYTIGKTGDDNHLLASAGELKSTGADVFHIDRGGDITYHGPGQLVGYPVLKLDEYYSDVHRYLRDLEEVIMRTLSEFGIESRRDGDFTGVWVGSDKIAAIGVRVSHWVTMHGFALNVNTDLTYFDRIIPCGIFHKGVTSIERLLKKPVPVEEVIPVVARCFGDVFGVVVRETDAGEYVRSIDYVQNTECLQ